MRFDRNQLCVRCMQGCNCYSVFLADFRHCVAALNARSIFLQLHVRSIRPTGYLGQILITCLPYKKISTIATVVILLRITLSHSAIMEQWRFINSVSSEKLLKSVLGLQGPACVWCVCEQQCVMFVCRLMCGCICTQRMYRGMYFCMHICLSVCLYIYISLCLSVCLYVCMHVCIYPWLFCNKI